MAQQASYTHEEAKAAMKAAGYEVSEGSGWSLSDHAKFDLFLLTHGRTTSKDGVNSLDPHGIKAAKRGFIHNVAPKWVRELFDRFLGEKEQEPDQPEQEPATDIDTPDTTDGQDAIDTQPTDTTTTDTGSTDTPVPTPDPVVEQPVVEQPVAPDAPVVDASTATDAPAPDASTSTPTPDVTDAPVADATETTDSAATDTTTPTPDAESAKE